MYKRLTKTRMVLEKTENRQHVDSLSSAVEKNRPLLEEIRAKLSGSGGWDLKAVLISARNSTNGCCPFTNISGRVSDMDLGFLDFGNALAHAWIDATPAELAAANLNEAMRAPTSKSSVMFGTELLDRIRQAHRRAQYVLTREESKGNEANIEYERILLRKDLREISTRLVLGYSDAL